MLYVDSAVVGTLLNTGKHDFSSILYSNGEYNLHYCMSRTKIIVKAKWPRKRNSENSASNLKHKIYLCM